MSVFVMQIIMIISLKRIFGGQFFEVLLKHGFAKISKNFAIHRHQNNYVGRCSWLLEC